MAEALGFNQLRFLISQAVTEELTEFCKAHRVTPAEQPARNFIELWCSETFPGWTASVRPAMFLPGGHRHFSVSAHLSTEP